MAVPAFVRPADAEAEDVVQGEHARLACGHAYHSVCIIRALRHLRGGACPLCRGALMAPVPVPVQALPQEPPRLIAQPLEGEVHLRRWDPATMRTAAFVQIIGRRASGRTTLVRDLLRKRPFTHRLILCGTDAAAYREYEPFVYGAYETATLETALRAMTISGPAITAVERRPCLVLDDVTHEPFPWSRDRALRAVVLERRFHSLTTLQVASSALALPPAIRAQTDLVFVFAEHAPGERQRLYSAYGGCFPDFATFCNVLDSVTAGPHEALVFDMNAVYRAGFQWERGLFWYKAEVAAGPAVVA